MIKRYLIILSLFTYSIIKADLPIVSDKAPKFAAFDTALINFMKSKGYEACTAAISIDKKVAHTIGIGWNDAEKTQPINPNIRMQIASLTKGITQIALYKLMQNKILNRNTRFWEFLNTKFPQQLLGKKLPQPIYAYKKIWEYSPSGMPEPKDPRVKNITIGQLIDHKSGWDNNLLGFDPQTSPDITKQALNLTVNPTPDDIIDYMLTKQTLQFAPGEKYSYSNFGYNILGRVIEKASGKNYINYLKQNIFAPLGITGIDLAYPKRQANEIWYPRSDIGYLIENLDSHGGLIASAIDLAKLFSIYWITGKPRNGQNDTLTFTGSLPTTTAVIYQTKKITVIVLINNRRDEFYQQDLIELINLIKKTAIN